MKRHVPAILAVAIAAGCDMPKPILTATNLVSHTVTETAAKSGPQTPVLRQLQQYVTSRRAGAHVTLDANKGWMELHETDSGVYKFNVMTQVTTPDTAKATPLEFYGLYDQKKDQLVPQQLWIGAEDEATYRAFAINR